MVARIFDKRTPRRQIAAVVRTNVLVIAGVRTVALAAVTARDIASDKQCIGVAAAPAPEGPFDADDAAPLVCEADIGGSIDASSFVDDDGTPYRELHVSDLEGNSVPFVTGDIEITDIAWAVNGKSIFFLAKRDEEADFNSLYRIGLAGGEAEQLFTHVNSIAKIFPSPNGSVLAFTATEAPPAKKKELEEKGFKAVVYEESVLPVKVWMLDLETLEATAHDLPGSASSFTWSAAGDRYAVALAPTPHVDDSYTSRDIYVVDVVRGKVQNKMGSVGKLGPFAFSPDGERIAYVGSVNINDPGAGRLYVASSSGGERRELVPEYLGHVSNIVWGDDGNVRWLGGRGVYTEWATASVFGTASAGPARGSARRSSRQPPGRRGPGHVPARCRSRARTRDRCCRSPTQLSRPAGALETLP